MGGAFLIYDPESMGTARVVMLALALAGQAASPPPDTEVFLATLSVRDGRVDIGKPINISNNAGYDNQPSFTPDGASVRRRPFRSRIYEPARHGTS